MNQAVITDKVVALVAGMTEAPPDRVGWDTRLFDELGLDSTGALELLMRIEDETGVEFDDDDMDPQHFETVGSLVGFTLEQLGG
jgi:acyl carrier protein